MRPRRERMQSSGSVGFNATPLIDLVFTLSIFYMLLSRFSTNEQAAMELPAPQESRAEAMRLHERVVMNCRVSDGGGDEGGGALFSLGPNRPESLESISERLLNMKRESPDLKVVLRADRRLPYSAVRAAMRAIAENEVELLNVAALTDEGG